MKTILIIAVVVIVLGAGWYFGSPLFLDKQVNEDFPLEVPTEDELAKMSPEEREVLRIDMEQKASQMPDTEVKEEMDEEPQVIARGDFNDADNFHKGSGTATIYLLSNGSHLLRLENFSVTNGPDLHVILSEGDEVRPGDYIDLGNLKGNKGDQNYTIPDGTEVRAFGSVIIYCKPFHVIFSTATLGL